MLDSNFNQTNVVRSLQICVSYDIYLYLLQVPDHEVVSGQKWMIIIRIVLTATHRKKEVKTFWNLNQNDMGILNQA